MAGTSALALAGLDDEQQTAVTAPPGRVCILSPWLGQLVPVEVNESDIDVVQRRGRRSGRRHNRRHRHRFQTVVKDFAALRAA